MYVLIVTQCSIQGHSQVYRVGDMLKVLVIPCAYILVLEVESTCLCFFQYLHASDSFYSTRPDSVLLQ